MSQREQDEQFLRRSFEVATRAQAHGNHPFGAVLVGPDGAVLLESENGYLPDHDMTGHAERLLATGPAARCAPELPARAARCTPRPSPAPCAPARSTGPASGGWSTPSPRRGSGRSPATTRRTRPSTSPAAPVFAAGQRPIEVVGPMLEEEGEALHQGVLGEEGLDGRACVRNRICDSGVGAPRQARGRGGAPPRWVPRKPPFHRPYDLGGAARRDPAQQGWGPSGSADGAGAQPP